MTQTLDWAQAFAQKQATLIAGTGYQYGDTDFVEYSEQLYAEFARQLRTGTGPVSVGDALVRAKQLYLQQNPSVGTLDEKAVLEATIFGLPMTKVDMAVKTSPPLSSSDILSSQKAALGTAGGDLGLVQADLTLGDALTRKTKQLFNDDGSTVVPDASWYEPANGAVVAAPAQPTLPLLTRNVSIFGRLTAGVLAGEYDAAARQRQRSPVPGAAVHREGRGRIAARHRAEQRQLDGRSAWRCGGPQHRRDRFPCRRRPRHRVPRRQLYRHRG